MEHTNTPEHRDTMRSVIWQKMVVSVREHTIAEIVTFLIGSFLTGLMIASTLDQGKMAQQILEWRNGAIPNSVVILIGAYFAPGLARFLWESMTDYAYQVGESLHIEKNAPIHTIEGMPTDKVIDHLITRSTFKREEIEAKFGVPRYRYSALVKKLKELGVLIPGENNMSVLNSSEWTRQKLTDLFQGRETAAELERGVTIIRSIPSPAPFERRAVACAT